MSQVVSTRTGSQSSIRLISGLVCGLLGYSKFKRLITIAFNLPKSLKANT